MNFAETSLSELAVKLPMATEIFRRYRMDFCCGGREKLHDVCAKKNINLDEIVEQLKQLNPSIKNDFSEMPLEALTKYIVNRYHEDLRKRLPELVLLAEKVERVHADHSHCPNGLTDALKRIHQDMFMHMLKEENILFPLIESGKGNLALMPVKVMTAEHDSHGKELEELHRLTNDFITPEDACPTWKALYAGLEKLEDELMNHIHLENNILFPKALLQQGK